MEVGRLGKSGLKVSKIILGGMSFGDKEWAPWAMDDEEEVFALLKHAYDKGIRTIDTANIYSFGKSEILIGKFLKKYDIDRSKVVILSKCYFPVAGFEEALKPNLEFVNKRGLSRKAIFDAVDESIERLGTYIDVLQIHRLDHETDKEEIMTALHDVVKSGKVRYIGASTMLATEFAQLQFIAESKGLTKFISMQNFHNLIYREEEREMIPFCKETGVGLIPWSPIAMGLLARPLDGEKTIRSEEPIIKMLRVGDYDSDKVIIRRVEKVASDKGVAMAQIAIAWGLAKGDYPIVGFSKPERIDQAVDALKVELSEEEIKYLEEPYTPHPMSGFIQ